jgi:hypothetical protein
VDWHNFPLQQSSRNVIREPTRISLEKFYKNGEDKSILVKPQKEGKAIPVTGREGP